MPYILIAMLSVRHMLIVFLGLVAALLSSYYSYTNRPAPLTNSFARNTTAVTSTVTIASATSTTQPPPPVNKKMTAVIGVILPLTGVQAVYGQGIKEGLDLAADGVNNTERFSIRLKLVYEDTMSEVKNAPAAARKLINQDHAVILITGLSPTSLAVAPIAEKNKVVLFTMASLATKLNDAGAFIFKNDDVSSRLGAGLANAARERKFASAGVLFANYNDSVVESSAAFMQTFKAADGVITGEESFTQDTTDFRTHAQKLISAKPETIAIFGLQRDCALAVTQLRQLGYQKPLFGFTCVDDPMVVSAAGASAEGIMFVSFNAPPTEKFSNLIKIKYGHEPLRWSAEAFDGLKMLAVAASRSSDGKNPLISNNIRETLTHITGYTGEAGTVTFDKDGNGRRTLFIKTVKNGKIEVAQ